MSTGQELQKYGTVDVNAAVERRKKLQAEQAEKASRAGYLKTPEGKTLVRLGPPWKASEDLPIKEVWIHKMKDPNDLQAPPKVSIPCPAKNHGKKCLVCQKCQDLKRSSIKAEQELAYQWGAQQRYFSQVVNMEKPEDGWQLWEYGVKIFDQLLAILGNEDSGGDVTHPLTGRNVIIDRTGKGMKDTKYIVTASVKATKFPKMELLNSLIDLDLLAAVDQEKVDEYFNGTPEATDENIQDVEVEAAE